MLGARGDPGSAPTGMVAAVMHAGTGGDEQIDRKVSQLFELVSQALGQATEALLHGESRNAQAVVDGDQVVDELTAEVELAVWAELKGDPAGPRLRHLVGVLLILPELERSADLAEHIAQRAVGNLGREMSPLSRGIAQRMTE